MVDCTDNNATPENCKHGGGTADTVFDFIKDYGKKMNILTKARNILGWVSNRIKSFLNKTANKQKRR